MIIYEYKKRWKYLLVAYLFGYVYSLIKNGVPDIYYLIPIKIGPFFIAWVMGNGFYHAHTERPPVFKNLYYAVQYSISGAILCMILMIPLLIISMISGISINTFIGIAH